jgi:hypothetical protein
MDQNMPHWVFGASAAFMMLTVVLAPFTERRSQSGRADAEPAQP